MSTTVHGLTGLTCQHCVNAVTEEISAIAGVESVAIDLVSGGTSTLTITSADEIDPAALEAAVDEAGEYTLTDPPA